MKQAIPLILLVCAALASTSQAATLRATADQLFYVNGTWTAARALLPGDTFTTPDGRVAAVTNVGHFIEPRPVAVYSLQTGGLGTYFADDLLVAGRANASAPTEACPANEPERSRPLPLWLRWSAHLHRLLTWLHP